MDQAAAMDVLVVDVQIHPAGDLADPGGPLVLEHRVQVVGLASAEVSQRRTVDIVDHRVDRGLGGALDVLDLDRLGGPAALPGLRPEDRKSTRLNSSHVAISYAVFCL